MNRSHFEQDGDLSVFDRVNDVEHPGKLFHRLHIPKYMTTVMFDDDHRFGSNQHSKDPNIHQLPFMMMKHYAARGYVRDRNMAHNLAHHALRDDIPSALEELADMSSQDTQKFGGPESKDEIIEDILKIFFDTLGENHKSGRYTITDAKFNALMRVFDILMRRRSNMAKKSYELQDPNQFDLHDAYKANYLRGRSKDPRDYILNVAPRLKDIDPVHDLSDETPIIGNLPGGDETIANPFFLFDDPSEAQANVPLKPSRGFPSSRLHLMIPGVSSSHNLADCLL